MDPLLASIIMFGGNFAPVGYAYCDGQLLSVSQNQALFSLLGTTYGGNGQSTFGLPNLQGRVPIHRSQSGSYPSGQTGGTEVVTLNANQLPAHTHPFSASGSITVVNTKGTSQQPQANGYLARGYDPLNSALPQIYLPAGTSYTTQVNIAGVNVAGVTGVAGGTQPVGIVQPYQVVGFIIATQGVYPSRS